VRISHSCVYHSRQVLPHAHFRDSLAWTLIRDTVQAADVVLAGEALSFFQVLPLDMRLLF
jgi:hypothetical protein